MTGFSLANMVIEPHPTFFAQKFANFIIGLWTCQIHDQMFRSQLPRKFRRSPSSQSTMGLPRYTSISLPPRTPSLTSPGIWKIIRGWLDPVVASKVQFTNNVEEMSEFVPRSQILAELGGDENWEYKFVEPVPGENDLMKDTATRDKLLKERENIVDAYEKATLEWINSEGKTPEIKTRRTELAKELRDDYWKLDPYVRAKSLYDRTGVINPGGKLDFYPKAKGETAPAVAAAPAVETSADDID